MPRQAKTLWTPYSPPLDCRNIISKGQLPNGLLIFAGNGVNQEGKQRGYEPELPVLKPMYRCENHFRTEILEEMLLDYQ